MSNRTITTNNGFTVTITSGWVRPTRFDTRFDSAWTCTCGRGLNARGTSSVDDAAEAHARMHDAQGTILTVNAMAHANIVADRLDRLAADFGDAIISVVPTTETITRRGRTITLNGAEIQFSSTRTTAADVHAAARSLGFTVHGFAA
jgi:hypothetical protein